MMVLVRTVAGLHLIVYLGIIWYGWQSYRLLLRKKSWTYMGVGFTIFLIYRIRQFAKQMIVDYPVDTESTLIPFVASIFLLIAFRMLYGEHKHLISLMAEPPSPLRSGAQPVEYWLSGIRKIVHEEGELITARIIRAIKPRSKAQARSRKYRQPAPKER